MAISFSQVKTITISEGSVTKITDSTGNILWQSASWHTIWEGDKTCYIKSNYSDNPTITGAETNFAHTISGTGYTPIIRITFSCFIHTINTSQLSRYFTNSNTAVSRNPDSPNTINPVSSGSIALVGSKIVASSSASNNYIQAYLQKVDDSTNNRINFNLVANKGGIGAASSNCSITITKIEQYY